MILIEHAVVVTMDPARRVLRDGSVLVDGARIVQVDVSGALPTWRAGLTARPRWPLID